jgi:hypothetical protein
MTKIDHGIAFQEKGHFLPKIGEDGNHNIDPWVAIFLSDANAAADLRRHLPVVDGGPRLLRRRRPHLLRTGLASRQFFNIALGSISRAFFSWKIFTCKKWGYCEKSLQGKVMKKFIFS